MLNDREQQHDFIEAALRELDAAEHAAVFRRTAMDASALLGGASARHPATIRWARLRWVPLAAAAMVAVGVWSWMFHGELAGLRKKAQPVTGGASLTTGERNCDGVFSNCFSGPKPTALASCRTFDFDDDGDVDLMDFRSYQIACDGQTRLR